MHETSGWWLPAKNWDHATLCTSQFCAFLECIVLRGPRVFYYELWCGCCVRFVRVILGLEVAVEQGDLQVAGFSVVLRRSK